MISYHFKELLSYETSDFGVTIADVRSLDSEPEVRVRSRMVNHVFGVDVLILPLR